jgi:tetratricopeptide (TPR) repeat protein
MAPAFLVRGMVFRARKEVPAAMKSFSNAVTLDPRDLRPRLAIAETAEAVANYNLAARVYRDVITLNPKIEFVVRERFLQSLVETDQMEEASKLAKALLAEQPASATAHLCAGRAAAWLDRRPEALQHFAEFEKIAPKTDGLAPYFIGLCELANGRLSESQQAFERAATSIRLKSNALTALGVVLHQEGKHAEAEKAFKEALADAPVGLALRIQFHLGLLSLDQKDWNAAKQHFIDSGSFVVNLEINSMNLEALYKRSPKNALASTSLGALFTSEKMPAAAVQAFRKSQETNNKDVLALLLGSNLSALQLNYDEALKQLATVGSMLENYWPAYYAAGSIEYSRRDYEKALPYLVNAAKYAPENVNVQTRLIALYLLTQKNEEAEAACIEMINRIPNSPVGYNELAGLLTARGDAESLANALEVATKAVELNPKSGLYLDTLGWVHFKQGKFDVALEELSKAEDMEPGNPEIQYHLGAALVKAGKFSEAIVHLNLAVVTGPGSDIAKEATSLLKQISQNREK